MTHRTVTLTLAAAVAAVLAGCNNSVNVGPPQAQNDQAASSAPAETTAETTQGTAPTPGVEDTAYTPPAQQAVSVEEDPPLQEPAPIETASAPPPMLVDPPPPAPGPDYTWTGGYWAWQGQWVWVHGHWSRPPRPGYRWFNPYYDHRGEHVVFVDGFWGAPGVTFRVPGLGLSLTLEPPQPGVEPGPPPVGPDGVFVPPPPGSMPGIVVPAFLGCPPQVVTGSPPVVGPGMRVTNVSNTTITNTTVNNTTVNNTTIENVRIEAPPSAVATRQAVQLSVPARPAAAAALPPVVRVEAPPPAVAHPLPAYVPGRKVELPRPVALHAQVPPRLAHPAVAREAAPAAEPHAPARAVPPATHLAERPAPIAGTERGAHPSTHETPAQRAAAEHAGAAPRVGTAEPPRATTPRAAEHGAPGAERPGNAVETRSGAHPAPAHRPTPTEAQHKSEQAAAAAHRSAESAAQAKQKAEEAAAAKHRAEEKRVPPGD